MHVYIHPYVYAHIPLAIYNHSQHATSHTSPSASLHKSNPHIHIPYALSKHTRTNIHTYIHTYIHTPSRHPHTKSRHACGQLHPRHQVSAVHTRKVRKVKLRYLAACLMEITTTTLYRMPGVSFFKKNVFVCVFNVYLR
jgi:hypothetical protein